MTSVAPEDRALIEATCDALGLDDLAIRESAKTAALAVTHAPIGKGGRNYVTASKPGNSGQYPAYFQQVRNAIIKTGKTVAEASRITWDRLRAWARGEGNVGPEVQAAARKALAELEAVGKSSKIKESPMEPTGALAMEISTEDLGDLSLLEAKTDDGDAKMPSVFCVKDRAKVTPTKDAKCPKCGADLSKAVAAAKKD